MMNQLVWTICGLSMCIDLFGAKAIPPSEGAIASWLVRSDDESRFEVWDVRLTSV